MTVVNRILAALLALVLLLGGLLAAIEIVLAQMGRPPWLVPHPQWSAWLGQRPLTDGLMRAAMAGLVVLGLLLMLAALRRGKPHNLTLPSNIEGVQVTASRRGIERSLREAGKRVSGVRAVDVRAGRRTVKVRTYTASRSGGDDVQRQMSDVVSTKLQQLGLAGTLRPRVKVVTGKSR
jgi:hypothetical protein